jgi:hypothetical protein
MRERVLGRPGYGKAFAAFVGANAAPQDHPSWAAKTNPSSDDAIEA